MDQEDILTLSGEGPQEQKGAPEANSEALDNPNNENTRVLDRKRVYVDLPAYDANRPHRKGYVIDITSRGIGLKKVHTTTGDVINWVVCADEHFPVQRFSFVAKCKWTSIDRFNNDPLSGFQIIRISAEDSANLRKFLLFLGSRYFRDLTSHLRSEAALRSVEAQYRSIVDSQSEIIVRLLPDAGLSFANQAFCNFTRKHHDLLVGQNFFDWAVTNQSLDPLASLSLLTPDSPTSVSEFGLADSTGEVRVFEWVQKCFFNDNGSPAFYQLVGRDITERVMTSGEAPRAEDRRAEVTGSSELEQVRLISAPYRKFPEATSDVTNHSVSDLETSSTNALESGAPLVSEENNSRNLKIVADKANFGLAMAQMDGSIIYVNNYFANVHGLSVDDVVGKQLSIFHTEEQIRQVDRLNAELTKQGFFNPHEVWHCHVSGREFPMLMSGVLIHDENGNPTLMAVSAIDITDVKRMQEALSHSQKMEAVGTLAGGIAHDVNNALFVMTGYADLALAEASPGSRVQTYLNNILRAGQRIKEMLNQILSFGKGGTDEKKPVPLSALVKEVVKYMRGAMPKNVQLDEHINCPQDLVVADTTQIYQLLVNLIVNARDAMAETGGLLVVGLENIRGEDTDTESHVKLPDGPLVRLTVQDTGHGMTKEIRDRIFDPFFTTKQVGAGKGAGLHLIRVIADNHDAIIDVDSEPGKGSVFRVYFKSVEHAGCRPATETDATDPCRSASILFVDDDGSIREMTRQLLELMGHEVTLASSGKEALDLLNQNRDEFDVVITDMTMPGMSGLQLAREIKYQYSSLPVILCSGYTDVIEEAKASDMGVDAFLTKPFGRPELSDTIRELTEKAI